MEVRWSVKPSLGGGWLSEAKSGEGPLFKRAYYHTLDKEMEQGLHNLGSLQKSLRRSVNMDIEMTNAYPHPTFLTASGQKAHLPPGGRLFAQPNLQQILNS